MSDFVNLVNFVNLAILIALPLGPPVALIAIAVRRRAQIGFLLLLAVLLVAGTIVSMWRWADHSCLDADPHQNVCTSTGHFATYGWLGCVLGIVLLLALWRVPDAQIDRQPL